jgi:predicted Zn-dependent protease
MNKKVLILILTGTFLCTVISGLVIWSISQKKKFSPESLYSEGMGLAKQGDIERAVIFLTKALDKLPDNKQIIWQLAKLESSLKNSSEAQAYAQKAWNGGKKDKECFLLLLEHSGLPSTNLKVEYGQRLLEQINVENVRFELKGDMFFALEQFKEAEEIYINLYSKNKSSDLLLKNAIVKIKLKQNSSAVTILEQGIKDESINSKSLTVLISLKFLLKDSSELDSLYQLAADKNLEDTEFLYLKAFIYLIQQEENKALSILKFSLSKTEINSENARKARLLTAFIHFDNSNFDKLKEILNNLKTDDSPQGEAELAFISLLASTNLDSPKNLKEISNQIYRINKLMPDSFIIKMFKARIDTLLGNFNEALKFYDAETEPIHRVWSRFILDNALTLQKSGKLRIAMDLILAYHTLTKKGSLESLIMLRNLYVALGKFDYALKLQEFLLKVFPDNYELKLQTGYISVHKGDFKGAEEVFRNLRKNTPGKYLKPLNSAFFKILLKNLKYQEVLTNIDEMSEKFPDFLAFKAAAQAAVGNFKGAEEAYLSLIQKSPGSDSSRAFSFYILNRGKISEAKKLFYKAAKEWPNSGWPFLGLATIALKQKKYPVAQDMLVKALEDKNEHINASLLKAELNFIEGKFREAVDDLGIIELYKPGLVRLHEIKALCLLSLNKFELSLKSILKAISIQPGPSKTLIRIRNLIALNRLDEAENHTLNLINMKYKIETALELYVNMKIFKQDYREAIKKVQTMEAVISETAKVMFLNSITLASKGHEEAIKELEANFHLEDAVFKWVFLTASHGGNFIKKAEQMTLNDSDWNALAFECIRRKDFQNAAACLSHIKSIDPVMLNNYAWSLYKTGNFSKAYEIAQSAHQLAPRNSQITDTYAEVMLANKKYQQCIDLLTPAVIRGDEDEKYLLKIATSYERMKNKKMAVEFYKRLLQKMNGKNWNLKVTKESIETKLSELEQ